MFKVKETKYLMKKRINKKYEIKLAKTERYKQTSLPYMTYLLNDEHERKMKTIKIDDYDFSSFCSNKH